MVQRFILFQSSYCMSTIWLHVTLPKAPIDPPHNALTLFQSSNWCDNTFGLIDNFLSICISPSLSLLYIYVLLLLSPWYIFHTVIMRCYYFSTSISKTFPSFNYKSHLLFAFIGKISIHILLTLSFSSNSVLSYIYSLAPTLNYSFLFASAKNSSKRASIISFACLLGE